MAIQDTSMSLDPANLRVARLVRAALLRFALPGITLLLLAMLSGAATPVDAYQADPTHRELAKRTISGLIAPDPRYRKITVYSDIIINADVAEDADGRYFNHFYDPTTRLGLPRNGYSVIASYVLSKISTSKAKPVSDTRFISALDWARNGMDDHLDWISAIETYDYSNASRAKAYEALGHVLHLLQDMGQPDHATDRPHPGNTVLNIGYVGYEKLWTLQSTWPAGKVVVKRPSLEDAFNKLALESQQAENMAGLPRTDEVALGLGSLKWNRFPGLLSKGNPRFQDSLWAFYELHVPIVPKIPTLNPDQRTRDYLALGNTLLPRVEEYGAGLLEFYYDIVNPPPYVAAVQLMQNGTVKYQGEWKDQLNGEHLSGRMVQTTGDGVLDAGVDTEVRISFGPALSTGGQPLRDAVQNVGVWVIPASSTVTGDKRCADIAGAHPVGSGTYTQDNWSGTFVPSKDGTLCIEATDTNNHFTQRNFAGDQLDAAPGTAAHAGGVERYDWTGYEPGPDLNHHFTVVTKGCGQVQLTPAQLEAMRWGQWSGSWNLDYEGKTFDTAFGGHGKFTTTTRGSASGTGINFRSADTFYDPWYPKPVSSITFGHSRGTISEQGMLDKKYVDGFEEHSTPGGSGLAFIAGGLNLEPAEPAKPIYTYGVSIGGPVHGGGGDGNLCAGLRIAGEHTVEQGRADGLFWNYSKDSWSFAFSPTDPPPHVVLRQSLTCQPGDCQDAYIKKARSIVQPAVDQLSRLHRDADARQLYNILPAAVQDSTDLSAQLYNLGNDMSSAYSQCQNLWVSNDADADAKYTGQFAELQDMRDRYKGILRSIAERYATATEQAAAQAEAVSPEVANQLRQLAQQVRSKGLEGF